MTLEPLLGSTALCRADVSWNTSLEQSGYEPSCGGRRARLAAGSHARSAPEIAQSLKSTSMTYVLARGGPIPTPPGLARAPPPRQLSSDIKWLQRHPKNGLFRVLRALRPAPHLLPPPERSGGTTLCKATPVISRVGFGAWVLGVKPTSWLPVLQFPIMFYEISYG